MLDIERRVTMHLGEIIKEYRSKNNLSMGDFAEKSGISKAYISILEKNRDPRNGKKVTPSIPIIKKAALGMNVTFDELFNSLDNDTVVSFKSSPLLSQITETAAKLHEPRQEKVLTFTQDQLDKQEGRVEEERQTFRLRKSAAGPGIYVDDDDYDYEVVTASKVPHGADELVKILGDSMEPLIMKGEKVYIHHQPMVENGEIAIVRIGEEEVTCKHVYINKKEVTLKSENPKYDDMHYDTEKITILGKVIL